MQKGHSSRPYRWMGLGGVLGLLACASWALGQSTNHANPFEAKIGWIKGGFDAPSEERAHRLDEREPHGGQRSEYIELDVKPGKYLHYVYPVGKAPIAADLRAALWLRANRPGIQVMARIVLPNERDPNNLDYRMTTYIRGDVYQQVGRWQLMELSKPAAQARQQQQLMTAELKRNIDFTGAYVDALVLNVYAGPGATQVWIDDLEIGPLTAGTPFQPAVKNDNNNPAKPAQPRAGGAGGVVEFNGNRLVVGKQRVLFRAIRYTDTMLPVLRNAGFNTICFDRHINPATVTEAANWGLWVVPEFRVMNDDGSPLPSEEITKQVQRFADNDAVLFRRIGGILNYEQATSVARATQIARAADPGRPIAADVWDGLLPYSRSVQLLGMHRWPLMTTLEIPKYREWLESRKKLANPNTFVWTWIQTHLPDWYSELLYNQPALAEFRDPVGPQPEQVRLLTYTALSAGCRGLGFWSDRFLADSHHGRDRLLCCALLNQELDMMESMLVSVEDAPQWIETSVPDVKAAVLRCSQGVLVMPIWQGKFSQFVPGQASVSKLSLVVPQIPKTNHAWEVSPGDVRSLKLDRVDQGVKVTLPEFGLTSMIVFTADTKLVERFQDQARARRQLAAQWSHDMALYELEKVARLQNDLEQVGATIPDARALIEDSKRRLQRSKEMWDGRNFSEAYHEAQRALRPVRVLMRAQWEKAVRGLDTPVASPYALSFYTLPKHWAFMDQVRNKTTAGPNMLQGGDFEVVPERVQQAWKADRQTLDDVELFAERVTELKVVKNEPVAKSTKNDKGGPKEPPPPQPTQPIEGRRCAMLQIQPRDAKAPPPALERTIVAINSPEVKLPPGTLVQVSGWVCIPAPITASPDGALMYDSAGGEPLAIRWTEPTPWKQYTVYRRVPASGTIQVTLALTGVGTVYFDDIRIEPRLPNNSGGVDNNAIRRP